MTNDECKSQKAGGFDGSRCAAGRQYACGRDGLLPRGPRVPAVYGSYHASKCLLRRQTVSQRDTAHRRRSQSESKSFRTGIWGAKNRGQGGLNTGVKPDAVASSSAKAMEDRQVVMVQGTVRRPSSLVQLRPALQFKKNLWNPATGYPAKSAEIRP